MSMIKEALDSGIPEVRSYIEARYMNCRYNNYPKTRKILDEYVSIYVSLHLGLK